MLFEYCISRSLIGRLNILKNPHFSRMCISHRWIHIVRACAWLDKVNGLDLYVGDVRFLEYRMLKRRRKITEFYLSTSWQRERERRSLVCSFFSSILLSRVMRLSTARSSRSFHRILWIPPSFSGSRDPAAARGLRYWAFNETSNGIEYFSSYWSSITLVASTSICGGIFAWINLCSDKSCVIFPFELHSSLK